MLLSQHHSLATRQSSSTTLHLRVQEVAVFVNVLNGLLGDAVTLLLPRHGWVREDSVAGALGHGAVAAGLIVTFAIGQRNVEGGGDILEGLASRKVRGGALKNLVRSAQVGKLVIRGSGLGLVALDTNVEVGEAASIDLAVDANDLVVEVLLEVRLDVFRT